MRTRPILLVLLTAMTGLFLFGCASLVSLPDLALYQGIQASAVKSQLEDKGFTDITMQEVENDINTKHNDIVIEVKINGDVEPNSRGEVPPDTSFTIEYYGTYPAVMITMPEPYTFYQGKPHSEVKSDLEKLGFTNITENEVLNYDDAALKDTVTSVTIDSNGHFQKGQSFEAESKVIIAYYGDLTERPTPTETENAEQEQESSSSTTTSTVGVAGTWPTTTRTVEFSDSQGYTFEAEFEFGSWMKASDTAAIQKEWEQAGNEGEAPSVTSFDSRYQANYCAMTFMTVKLTNKTEGWDITKENPHTIYWIDPFTLIADPGSHETALSGTYNPGYIEYSPYQVRAFFSSGASNLRESSGSSVIMNPKMESNTWGPVTIGFAAADVFAPKYGTDANPEFMNCAIDLISRGKTTDGLDPQYAVQIPFDW